MIGKIGVRNRGQLADRRGIDPEHVLQIRADVGETMHHRLRCSHARNCSQLRQKLASGMRRGSRQGDIGAVRQFSVDARLCVVRAVEDGRCRRKGECKRDQRDAPRHPALLTRQRGHDDRRREPPTAAQAEPQPRFGPVPESIGSGAAITGRHRSRSTAARGRLRSAPRSARRLRAPEQSHNRTLRLSKRRLRRHRKDGNVRI